MAKSSPLSPREKTLCNLLHKGHISRHDAAVKAGYSPNGADVQVSRMLKRPKIIEYMTYLSEKQALSADYSREDIAKNLLDIAGLSLDGKKYQAAIRANELLGKDIGMFRDKLEVSGSIGVSFGGEKELED